MLRFRHLYRDLYREGNVQIWAVQILCVDSCWDKYHQKERIRAQSKGWENEMSARIDSFRNISVEQQVRKREREKRERREREKERERERETSTVGIKNINSSANLLNFLLRVEHEEWNAEENLSELAGGLKELALRGEAVRPLQLGGELLQRERHRWQCSLTAGCNLLAKHGCCSWG